MRKRWDGNETVGIVGFDFCYGWRVIVDFRLYSTASQRDMVVHVQQAMACIALTFHPGTIGFEPQNTVSACMQEAVTDSDS